MILIPLIFFISCKDERFSSKNNIKKENEEVLFYSDNRLIGVKSRAAVFATVNKVKYNIYNVKRVVKKGDVYLITTTKDDIHIYPSEKVERIFIDVPKD